MNVRATTGWLVLAAFATSAAGAADSQPADPRLREVLYDPHAVVTVPVKRGVVTLVVLDADESITEVAAGLGGDCTKTEAAWCVAAQPGGRNLFVKAKSSASAPNNLAVVTDRRTHSFRFVVLADNDPKVPVYRLVVKAPAIRPAPQTRLALRDALPLMALPVVPPLPSPREVIAERLQAKAQVRNSNYSIAEGSRSLDIVPTLVFDDGRFTYFRFPGNREVPAVFHVLGDGSEADPAAPFFDSSGAATLANINGSDTNHVLRAKVSYVYQAKYGGALGLFNLTGTSNTANQTAGYDATGTLTKADGAASNLTGNPATRGVTLEAFWMPIQYLRIGAQYTAYSRFNGVSTNYDGFGRNARDNNTLFLYTWLA